MQTYVYVQPLVLISWSRVSLKLISKFDFETFESFFERNHFSL
jgi:hypothetical protein